MRIYHSRVIVQKQQYSVIGGEAAPSLQILAKLNFPDDRITLQLNRLSRVLKYSKVSDCEDIIVDTLMCKRPMG